MKFRQLLRLCKCQKFRSGVDHRTKIIALYHWFLSTIIFCSYISAHWSHRANNQKLKMQLQWKLLTMLYTMHRRCVSIKVPQIDLIIYNARCWLIEHGVTHPNCSLYLEHDWGLQFFHTYSSRWLSVHRACALRESIVHPRIDMAFQK